MPLWLVNPGRGTRKAKRKGRRRRKLAGAALAAHERKVGRSLTGTARHAAKRAVHRGGAMAKRKRRRASNPKRRRRLHVRNPVVRHKRRRRRGLFQRNPGRGAIGSVMAIGLQGVKDGAGVVIGKAATRTVAGLVPFGANTGLVGALKQVVVAIGIGYGAHKVMGKDFARMVVAGGIAAPIESLVKSLNIPILSPALAAGDEAYAALGAYPGRAGMAAYPPALMPAGAGDGFGDGMGADYSWREM